MSMWKRDFASGLVILVPILVILFVFNWLYSQLAKLPLPRVEGTGLSPAENEALSVVILLVVFVFLVFALGYLMRTAIGRRIEAGVDASMNRLPLIRVLYNASKLAVETALTGTEELQKPVRIETWPGLRMTAFKTGKQTPDGREVLFLPTAPNITTGFVVEVDPSELEETDERVEEALTRILSAGFGETNEGIDIDVTDGRVAED